MEKPNLSIIIVNFNTKDLLHDCLTSILNHVKGIDYEVVVVDNGSSDGSIEEIKNLKFKMQSANWRTKLKIILNKKNLGFAKANNQALRQAFGPSSGRGATSYKLLLSFPRTLYQ